MKIPKFKIQIPSKLQVSNPNGKLCNHSEARLEIRIWNLFGIGDLEFGFPL
jgi:hypothetical protein